MKIMQRSFPSDAVLLGSGEMRRADALAGAIHAGGTFDLMANAAHALMDVVLAQFAEAARIAILCGPGNNGGDGYMLAHLLRMRGVPACVFAHGPPKPGTDAARAAALWGVPPEPLARFSPAGHDLIVDALFGAGLDRALPADVQAVIQTMNASGVAVLSVDVPSGLNADTGQVAGAAFQARSTVTFFRRKPGHVLHPGRALCGKLTVADIGIPGRLLETLKPQTFENMPVLWRPALPAHAVDAHKYARGGVGVVSGGPFSTGAARLSARAAIRTGVGAATVLSPNDALAANAAHLTSEMLAAVDEAGDLAALIASGKLASLVIGPGNGVTRRTAALMAEALKPAHAQGTVPRGLKGLVLDADALTCAAAGPDALFKAIADGAAPCVLTPHEGEFARLFPDLAGASKLERARAAAARSNAVVLLKGPDTVVAAPDGRAAINTNGTAALATAGSGDVLAGVIAALLAQGMPAWEAACAGAWMHGDAGRIAGEDAGAGAEGIADAIAAVQPG